MIDARTWRELPPHVGGRPVEQDSYLLGPGQRASDALRMLVSRRRWSRNAEVDDGLWSIEHPGQLTDFGSRGYKST